jgi:hypothetical protein
VVRGREGGLISLAMLERTDAEVHLQGAKRNFEVLEKRETTLGFL